MTPEQKINELERVLSTATCISVCKPLVDSLLWAIPILKAQLTTESDLEQMARTLEEQDFCTSDEHAVMCRAAAMLRTASFIATQDLVRQGQKLDECSVYGCVQDRLMFCQKHEFPSSSERLDVAVALDKSVVVLLGRGVMSEQTINSVVATMRRAALVLRTNIRDFTTQQVVAVVGSTQVGNQQVVSAEEHISNLNCVQANPYQPKDSITQGVVAAIRWALPVLRAYSCSNGSAESSETTPSQDNSRIHKIETVVRGWHKHSSGPEALLLLQILNLFAVTDVK